MSSTLQHAPDSTDLDLLFRLYSRELNRYAYGRLGDREAAADIVQDSFLRFLIWRRGHSEAALPQGPRFFLWRIVGNLTIDLVRRQRFLGPLASLEDHANEIIDPALKPDEFLELRQSYLLLKQALDEVPARHREALLLNRIDGLTHPEIGARLGVSASMVSKYIMLTLDHCVSRMTRPVRRR